MSHEPRPISLARGPAAAIPGRSSRILNLRPTSGTEANLADAYAFEDGYEHDREIGGSISAGGKARNGLGIIYLFYTLLHIRRSWFCGPDIKVPELDRGVRAFCRCRAEALISAVDPSRPRSRKTPHESADCLCLPAALNRQKREILLDNA